MSIVIVGMLDEREEALRIIKDQIERRGHETVLIDIAVGTGAVVPSLKADVSCREIVALAERAARGERDTCASGEVAITSLMAEGLAREVSILHASGELQGIVAITGMTGALISLPAMKSLPFGVPKLLISSAVAMPAHAEQLAEYFGSRDITVMHAVVDTVGMNTLVKMLAVNGANAISGMVEGGEVPVGKKRPSIAITEFGFCDKGAHYIREILEKEYEVVSFHSNGMGDRALLDLVRQGFFKAFVDLVPGTFSEYLLGGNRPSGPDRLDAAKDLPIPYIFCPGGMDMISCGPLERRDKADPLWITRKLAQRKLLVQDALRVQARTSPEEMEQMAIAVSERLNRYKYKTKVKVVIPRNGFSSISIEKGALFDPFSDEAFIVALERCLDPAVDVRKIDADINTPVFARAVVDALSEALDAEA